MGIDMSKEDFIYKFIVLEYQCYLKKKLYTYKYTILNTNLLKCWNENISHVKNK